MKVITVTNKKGGVGKTTHAAHLAAGLAHRYRVGLIDAGPQGDLSTVLGVQPYDAFYSLLIEDAPLGDETVVQVNPDVYCTPDHPAHGELFLIPGWDATADIGHNLDIETGLFKVLDLCEEFTAQYQLDYIVIDTQPTRTILDGAVWTATDGWVYITTPETLSFKGLQAVIDRFREFGEYRMKRLGLESRVLAIIPNKVRPNTILHQENLTALAGEYGVFKKGGLVMAPCRLLIAWPEATQFERRTVYAYAPTSEAAGDAWRIAQGIEERVTGWQTQISG